VYTVLVNVTKFNNSRGVSACFFAVVSRINNNKCPEHHSLD